MYFCIGHKLEISFYVLLEYGIVLFVSCRISEHSGDHLFRRNFCFSSYFGVTSSAIPAFSLCLDDPFLSVFSDCVVDIGFFFFSFKLVMQDITSLSELSGGDWLTRRSRNKPRTVFSSAVVRNSYIYDIFSK